MNGLASSLLGPTAPDAAAVVLAAAHPLVHLNAALNLVATILLLTAFWQVRAGREQSHGRTMLAALAVSAAFLASYLTYHAMVGHVSFTREGAAKTIYRTVLLTHVLLAFTVPFLAIPAAFLGAKSLGWVGAPAASVEEKAQMRARHLRLVRWAFPIWLYVSVTGVLVYLMLYHLWPSAEL